MNRRGFLHATAAGGAALLASGAAGGAALLAGGAARASNLLPASSAASNTPHDPPLTGLAARLEGATIRDLNGWMEAGEASSAEIVEGYLARIEAIDRNGPALNSVIELNPDALDIAERLDAERASGRVRGPLHGIPILIKDNIDTGDRMMTTAGSLALVGAPASRDAHLVERLRAAGAVILGKTNLSEWANFRGFDSTSGWSARGGLTLHPVDQTRNPCGSSSGSAVAVAASLCAAAVGTETDGSIVCPAHACGIVGIKPTLGLLSRSGIVPIAHSFDTAGPMARTVEDAAILLTAMAGEDPRDAATLGFGGRGVDYGAQLGDGDLRGVRIGVARQFFGFDARVDRVMEDVILRLRDAGATVIDPVELTDRSEFDESAYAVMLCEFKHGLNAYLATRTGVPVRTLEDVIAFNEAHAEEELRWFGQEILQMSQRTDGLSDHGYRGNLELAKRKAGAEGIDATMARHGLDAIMAPTGGPAWVTDLVHGDHFDGGSSSHAAVAGYPNITVPAGEVAGLPVGVSLFSRAGAERRAAPIGSAIAWD